MNAGRYLNVALCLLAMTGVAAAILLSLGLSPLTALLAAIAIACPLAALYAWWLARRAVQTVERAVPGTTAEKRLRRQRS